MSSAGEQNVLKLLPLNKPTDYIHWKRRIYAFIRKDDPDLVGFSGKQEDEVEVRSWVKKSAKAKSNIVLSLGPDPISQTRKIIDDDDKNAKDLWQELNRIYTTTSGQAVQNLRPKLDSLVFDDSKDWNEHVSSFLKICEELATYDEKVTEAEKTSNLIRSLPTSFSPLAMVSTITSTTFEKVVNAVDSTDLRLLKPSYPVEQIPTIPKRIPKLQLIKPRIPQQEMEAEVVVLVVATDVVFVAAGGTVIEAAVAVSTKEKTRRYAITVGNLDTS